MSGLPARFRGQPPVPAPVPAPSEADADAPPAGLAVRLLTEAEALIALRRQVVAGLADDDCYVLEPDRFVRAHLGGRGETVGLVAADRLVAYAMLGLPRGDGPADPMAAALGMPPAGQATVAHLASTMVLPAWRGRGLHNWLIRRRLARCAALGRPCVLSMVSPRNVASWHNLMRHGLAVRAIAPLEGERPRYLMHRDLRRDEVCDYGTTQAVPLDDLDRQRALLGDGYRGFGAAQDRGRVCVLFGRPGPCAG
jgi:GNAT superfamily N-acetyltransferase